jgi:hypothetical protein
MRNRLIQPFTPWEAEARGLLAHPRPRLNHQAMQQQQGNVLAQANIMQLEHDAIVMNWFIALDASSNVLPIAPTNAPAGAGPYTLAKGCGVSIGAGTILHQPHISTGLYEFTLDQPWAALLNISLTLYDQGAVACPVWSGRANVRASQNASSAISNPRAGVDPGTDTTLLAQTIYIRFRTASTGALVDPAASTGFWLQVWLKRTFIP